MAQSGIYAIRNVVNGKVYVGSAVSIHSRWSNHRARLSKNNHHSKKLQNAWNKYGQEAFEFIVLAIVERERLITVEQQWINHFQASGLRGYNVNPVANSQFGRKVSEASIQKCRKTRMMRPYTHSEETRKKLSLAHKGRVKSESWRRAISESRKGCKVGVPKTAKQIAAVISSNKRRIWTPQAREKIAALRRGKPVNRLVMERMWAKNCKPVECTTTGAVFPSTVAASLALGIGQSTISNVCAGRGKSAYGLHFRHIGEG